MTREATALQKTDHYPIAYKSEQEVLRILDGHLPSCIANCTFSEDGFILGKGGRKLIPIYMTGLNNGHSDVKKIFFSAQLNDQLDFHIMDPVAAISEYIDVSSSDERRSEVIQTICHDLLLPKSKAMVAFLDKENAELEVGTEIATMALSKKPVIGIRLDSEPHNPTDAKVSHFLDEPYQGILFEGVIAQEESLYYLARLRDELLNPPAIGEVSHRTNPLRNLQNALPTYIVSQIRNDRFPGTKIEASINEGKQLTADDITLSQLQMMDYLCGMIRENKDFPDFNLEYILTSLLNGADGPVARRLGPISKEGGIKDAGVDRLSEIMVVNLIADKINMSPELAHELRVSFQLSTLTKAACEMSGVKTKEGGVGGMINRRMTLFFILKDLIKLNKLGDAENSKKENIIAGINKRVHHLIDGSREKAMERIDLMAAQKVRLVEAPVNPDASGASEARKYAGIVTLNYRTEVDIVSELNVFAGGKVIFPSLNLLVAANKYIRSSLGRAEGFLKEALRIAGYEK